MRIAICGSACQGKSTLVNDFIKAWPNYIKSAESYREAIKKEKLKINKEINKDSQWKILNCLIDDVQKTSKNDYVIFDRCPIDNLVYSLWSFEKQTSDIDREFIDKCIPLVRESMKFIDIIFFVPITKIAPVQIEPKDNREIDKEFIEETDNIFKAIEYSLMNKGTCPFFNDDDRPPIIEVFGSPEQRIEIIKLYVNKDGDIVDDGSSVLSTENIDMMEKLLREQREAGYQEKIEQKLKNKIILGE
jgi:hypothetical protein